VSLLTAFGSLDRDRSDIYCIAVVIQRDGRRALHVDPGDPQPIWRQIEDGFRRLVVSGALRAGAVVPSVRELARELQVNPATVAKAYQRLADVGLLAVKRGEGTFVAEEPPALAAREKERELGAAALRYASVAVTIGASRDEAVGSVREAFTNLKEGRR
jgi:DNA-binding transcriptional regulator YhcF (GntR family)